MGCGSIGQAGLQVACANTCELIRAKTQQKSFDSAAREVSCPVLARYTWNWKLGVFPVGDFWPQRPRLQLCCPETQSKAVARERSTFFGQVQMANGSWTTWSSWEAEMSRHEGLYYLMRVICSWRGAIHGLQLWRVQGDRVCWSRGPWATVFDIWRCLI